MPCGGLFFLEFSGNLIPDARPLFWRAVDLVTELFNLLASGVVARQDIFDFFLPKPRVVTVAGLGDGQVNRERNEFVFTQMSLARGVAELEDGHEQYGEKEDK